MREAIALGTLLATKAPLATRYIIDAVQTGLDVPLPAAQVVEATLFGLVSSTADMREGTRAFIEKRKPVFQGK
jgi:enoyl-CoA hydratase